MGWLLFQLHCLSGYGHNYFVMHRIVCNIITSIYMACSQHKGLLLELYGIAKPLKANTQSILFISVSKENVLDVTWYSILFNIPRE